MNSIYPMHQGIKTNDLDWKQNVMKEKLSLSLLQPRLENQVFLTHLYIFEIIQYEQRLLQHLIFHKKVNNKRRKRN